MRKNILLIVLVAAIFVFVGAISNSAKAADDPVEALRNAKTPVHLHSLAGGTECNPPYSDSLVHQLPSMIGTWWHSIYPSNVFCHNWQVVDERDNGTAGLNRSDKLKLNHVATSKTIWVHVEEVTLTLILDRVADPFDTMYVEFSGGVDSIDYAIANPVSTWWHEVWPEWCVWWHIDVATTPPLACCTIIEVNGIEYHITDMAIDILVQSIPDPTVPTLTQWGVVILVLLILGSAIFIMLRRRKVPVPA
jgi:hypothetical protein